MIIIKYYLVDSENVNDNWLLLFELVEDNDKIIVFYTKNSPHMSYASVVKLLNSKYSVDFEECFEGSNALDFQLVSYLGYMMNKDALEGNEFIIMSNDCGYDAAVNFLKKKNLPVKRYNVNYCKSIISKQIAIAKEEESPASAIDLEVPVLITEIPNPDIPVINDVEEDNNCSEYDFDKSEVDLLINCLGKDNLTAIHETLVHVYGSKPGQKIYKKIKEKTYPFTPVNYKRKDKLKHFSDIIFSHSDLQNPGNFEDFLEDNKNNSKNLNTVRAAITKAYGDGNGLKYYSHFKPYFKMISTLK